MQQSDVKTKASSANDQAIFRANGKSRANNPDHIEIAIKNFEKARKLWRMHQFLKGVAGE